MWIDPPNRKVFHYFIVWDYHTQWNSSCLEYLCYTPKKKLHRNKDVHVERSHVESIMECVHTQNTNTNTKSTVQTEQSDR